MEPDPEPPADERRRPPAGGPAPAVNESGSGHRSANGLPAVGRHDTAPTGHLGNFAPGPSGTTGENPQWAGGGFVANRGEALGGGPGFAPAGPVEGPPDPGDEFDDEPAGPRRRPRWVRVVGLVIALALVLGSVSTGIGIILGGGTGPAVPSVVDSVQPAPDERPGSSLEAVTATLANATAGTVTPVCTVAVVLDGVTLGSVTARAAQPLPAGDRVSATVSVPISRAAFAGTPGDARVSCTG